MLKTYIDLENYEKIEKTLSSLERKSLERLVLFDAENRLSSTKMRSLENYLAQTHPGLAITIMEVPKDAAVCLVAAKKNI
tara:strand:- start:1080 stop:1319 length:240 start_codon:yes stop_codon:yes gene_type:complete